MRKHNTCQHTLRIYFTKNTDIPLKTVRVVSDQGRLVRKTTKYTIMSIGKPDEKLFEPVPLDWAYNCSNTAHPTTVTDIDSK